MKTRMKALVGAVLTVGLAYAAPQAQGQAPAGGNQGQAQQQGPHPKSKGEQDAIMKVQQAAQANDPQALLAAVSNVLESYTDTEYKPMLLDMAVQAAQQSGDYANTLVWGDRAIQANPNDIDARVITAQSIAANSHPTDLDKDKSIQKINSYANQALDLLKTTNTPPIGVTPQKFPDYKAHLTGEAYDALGQAYTLDNKNADAIKEFQLGVQADPTDILIPARMTKTYNAMKQYDDAIAAADKVLALKDCPASDNSPCADPRVKSYVTAQKNFATKMKGASAPKPAAPATGSTPAPSTTTPAPNPQ